MVAGQGRATWGYRLGPVCLCALALSASPVAAQDSRIAEDLPLAEIDLGGFALRIERAQDPAAMLSGEFARTARACPPFCIQPIRVAPGVATLGELELIAFLQEQVASGAGLLIDARLPEWHAKGTIPGAVNVPFATLAPDNPLREDLLLALGVTRLGEGQYEFSAAMEIALFCNGAWSDQAPLALQYLLEAGYPPEKLRYYRGGMQDWQVLGLTVAPPGQQG
jgi:rhodanese-related sulfurtransferase